MKNQTPTKKAKRLAITLIGKACGLIVFGLLLLKAAHLKIMRQKLIHSFLLLGILIFTTSTSAQSGTWTIIDYPGAIYTTVIGINDAGDMLGRYKLSISGEDIYFKLSNGIFTPINNYPEPGWVTTPVGINDAGEIVGKIRNTFFGVTVGFRLTNGNYTTFYDPTAGSTVAIGFNDAGDIIGYTISRLFKMNNDIYTTVPPYPGFNGTTLTGINDAGDIVGYYWFGNGDRGFKLSNGIYSEIVYPGSVNGTTRTSGINDAGDIVGNYNNNRGFKLSNGIYTTIHYPGASSTGLTGINDAGDIVGSYNGSNGNGSFKLNKVNPKVKTANLLF